MTNCDQHREINRAYCREEYSNFRLRWIISNRSLDLNKLPCESTSGNSAMIRTMYDIRKVSVQCITKPAWNLDELFWIYLVQNLCNMLHLFWCAFLSGYSDGLPSPWRQLIAMESPKDMLITLWKKKAGLMSTLLCITVEILLRTLIIRHTVVKWLHKKYYAIINFSVLILIVYCC